ncbi:poly(A)-specific ribonuclease PNLDC1 isoform X7 [Centrocercus urophasianus]|uniref:poly(A)-specific ribonuclease PNLDC1 isoform X7 n=1 Tax=Centrocercus urophasianus TaxID=9002 RepID=UPI001C651995|nr:poly(A)-specific ribonuclease PNLDC1 isoform X7 [Centrocercus urophasianus]
MDVGAADFARCLPSLRDRVRRAAFLGLDMEFTGLHSVFPQNNQPSLFDSPAERYQKVRQSVQRFTITQLGLAIFSEENSNKYVVHSYNFFLFPSTLGVMDAEFTLSASSIQFLSHYGFDYNKFLKDGIPYMNELQEKILSQRLLQGSWEVCSALNMNVVKKAIDEVTCWIAAAKEGDSMILQDLSGMKQDSQMLDVQLVLRQALPNVWTEPLGDNEVMVKKVSPQHRCLLESSSHDSCQKELILTSARGFTNLFQIIVKAKKPLVGHNMLMDLCHLHDKFYNPLPESYEEFKKNIHHLFPVLIDTKTVTKSIWKNYQFPRVSNLLEVYEVLCSDAAKANSSFSQYLTMLAEYLNKVNVIRGGVSSINFSGEDASCRYPPPLVVRVRGWPRLDERQIYQELQPLCRFDIRRLSENQFILLSNRFKHVIRVLRDYKNHPKLQISVYRHWRHSPHVNCLLKVSGIVALWSLLAFVLGGSPSRSP